jgi:hypothetical protein
MSSYSGSTKATETPQRSVTVFATLATLAFFGAVMAFYMENVLFAGGLLLLTLGLGLGAKSANRRQ